MEAISGGLSSQISETSPHDWRYVSEGGATIVFSYIGAPHPRFSGTVLRLRKKIVEDIPQTSGGVELDDPTVEFQRKVIERLIPLEHLPHLETITVERSWLEVLEFLYDGARPLERRQRHRIDCTNLKAVLANDLVGGESLAIEIKPKWGFLPSSIHLSSSTQPVKTQTCRFCMHAHFRTTTAKAVYLNNYCPLDLYSGDSKRISKALSDLWDVWVGSEGTVNNLRLFVHGNLVKPSYLAPIYDILGVSTEADRSVLRQSFISATLPLLLDTPILRILSRLQRTLDALDIEGLSKLWSLAHSSPTSQIGSMETDPSLEDWTTFVDEYLASHNKLDHAHPDPANLRYYLLGYLLSATFKDCSIILRPFFRTRTINTGGNTATVIDLDPKGMDRLKKWEKLDDEIVQFYTGVSHKKTCVDSWVESR